MNNIVHKNISNQFTNISTTPSISDIPDGTSKVFFNTVTEKMEHYGRNGNDIYKIGGGDLIVDTTYANLVTLIGSSELIPGLKYRITDRGDRGITVTALTTNKLALTASRLMLCPKSYAVGALDGNAWKGVWHSTKTFSINDLCIWGGLVWKNITGAIGTATVNKQNELDSTNWILISKSNFSNNEYIEKIFAIDYDYGNDWISKQYDDNGNEYGCDFEYFVNKSLMLKINANPVDLCDYNYNYAGKSINNNKALFISNNVEGVNIYGNVMPLLAILENKCTSTIANNILKPNSTSSSSSSTGHNATYRGIKGNICSSIINNVSVNIIDNNNSTMFISNNIVNTIIGNLCQSISSNNGFDISFNTANVTSISTNNVGFIQSNDNIGVIEQNIAREIRNSSSLVTFISYNRITNVIYGNNISGNIYNNICNEISFCNGTGNISYTYDFNSTIIGRTLAYSYFRYPYANSMYKITQTGSNAPIMSGIGSLYVNLSYNWVRLSIGLYELQCTTGVLPQTRTYFKFNNYIGSINYTIDSSDKLTVETRDSSGVLSDNIINNVFMEVLVFM